MVVASRSRSALETDPLLHPIHPNTQLRLEPANAIHSVCLDVVQFNFREMEGFLHESVKSMRDMRKTLRDACESMRHELPGVNPDDLKLTEGEMHVFCSKIR